MPLLSAFSLPFKHIALPVPAGRVLGGGLSVLFMGLMAGLFLWLFYPTILWFSEKVYSSAFTGLLVIMLGLSCYFRPPSRVQWQVLHFPWLASLLFGFSVLGYLANENYLGIHIFSAALFIAAAYGLAGMVLCAAAWRGLFFPCCLLIVILPFEGYLDIYFGFPLRLLSSNMAAEVLQVLGFMSISNESIILIESKAANVDLGCSGIKGLWAGGVFYLLLSLIEGHKISWRWLGIGLGLMACLLFSNVLRIVLLVLLGIVADLPAVAERLHQSMGLLAFSVSCLLAWSALRLSQQSVAGQQAPQADVNAGVKAAVNPAITSAGFPWLAALFFIAVLLLAVFFHKPYTPGDVASPAAAVLPEALHSQGIALTDVEDQFFSSKQAQANKYRFDFEGLRGSLLIVNSHYWRAQHEPHNCYIGQGYKLGFEGTWLLGGGKTVRFLQVGTPEQTAIYWFQAGDTITAEYSARVLDAVLAPEKNWLMVSLLLDENHRQDEVDKLLGLLQRSLGLQISEG